jgi:hypothetical protein
VRERNIELGKLAISRGLATRQAVSDVFKALPPDAPIEEALVARGVLGAADAASLARELASASDATVAGGALHPGPPPARGRGDLPAPGDAIGDYEVVSLLGKGGMGAVYKAVHKRTGAEAAIKVVLDGEAEASMLERFRRESEAMAKVDRHAGIVRIRASGTWGSRALPYAVMDFVVGHDLAAEVKDAPLPVERALALVGKVARAIHHCHEQGILHRDLKPANVLVREEDDEPLVTDFGLARDETKERLTKTGEVLGTPAFMAPEQAEGAWSEQDARTDVYGLGAILYQCLTGKPPFEADSQIGLVKKVLLEDPVSPSAREPRVPRDASVVALTCLAKEKQHRYATALEVAEELERVARGEPIRARPPGALERWRRWAWRRRRFVAAWTVIIASALGAFAIKEVRDHQERKNRLDDATTAAIASLTRIGVPAFAPGPELATIDSPTCERCAAELRPTRDFLRVEKWLALFRDPAASLEGATDDRDLDAAAALRLFRERRSRDEARRVVLEFVKSASAAAGTEQERATVAKAILDYEEDHAPEKLKALMRMSPPPEWTGAVAASVVPLLEAATSGRDAQALLQAERAVSIPFTPALARILRRWLAAHAAPLSAAARGFTASIWVGDIVRSVRRSAVGDAEPADEKRILDDAEQAATAEFVSWIHEVTQKPTWNVVERGARELWPVMDSFEELDDPDIVAAHESLGQAFAVLDTSENHAPALRFKLYALGIMHGFDLYDYLARLTPEDYKGLELERTLPDSQGTNEHKERRRVEKELAALTAYLDTYDPIFDSAAPEEELERCRKDAKARHVDERLARVRADLASPSWDARPAHRDFLRAVERYAWARALGRLLPIAVGGERRDDPPSWDANETAREKAYRDALAFGHPRWVLVTRRLHLLLAARCQHDVETGAPERLAADVKACTDVGDAFRARIVKARRDLDDLVARGRDRAARLELARRRMNGEHTAFADESIVANSHFIDAWALEAAEKASVPRAHDRRRAALEAGIAATPHPAAHQIDYARLLDAEGRTREALEQAEKCLASGDLRGGRELDEARAYRDELKAKLGGH